MKIEKNTRIAAICFANYKTLNIIVDPAVNDTFENWLKNNRKPKFNMVGEKMKTDEAEKMLNYDFKEWKEVKGLAPNYFAYEYEDKTLGISASFVKIVEPDA